MTSDLDPVVTCGRTKLAPQWLSALRSLRIERSVGLVGRATLRFVDLGYGLSAGDQFTLGSDVKVSEPGGGTLFEGTVTGVNLDLDSQAAPQFTVVADDAAFKLMRGTQVTTYLNGSYTAALQRVCSRHGLRPELGSSTMTMEYLLQAGTDLEFLNSVCERLGFSWFVDENKTLVAKKLKLGSPVATLDFGSELDSFTVRASGLRPTEVSVVGWNPDQQKDFTDKNPASTTMNPPAFVADYLGAKPAKTLTKSATSVADRPALTAGEAKTMADAMFEEWSSAAVVAKGQCAVDSRLKPGETVSVAQAGPLSGKYLVTGVEHTWFKGRFLTKFECGPRRPAGLVDTLAPKAADPGFAVSGLVVAVVTDANDPDGAGRVKVKYAGIDGDVESPWARVVTLGGGKARGAVFYPEVKDEVLVGFEHGDTRRPVVLGGLFSKSNTLPNGAKYVANGKVNYRRIASRKNHIVEFADGDQPSEQHVLLKLGTKEHRIRVGADRFDIEVTNGTPLTIKAGGSKFDISNSGDITIEGTNVTIKAKAALKLEGAQLQAKGTGTAAFEGAQVSVKAQGVGSVEASGPLTIKGAVVSIN
ncbi:type VI secretion system Vgr family protein [Jatrophihabitans fulvus]